jgi:hypothetical protein
MSLEAFLTFSCIILACPFVLMIIKAFYHFDYLKKIHSEKYKSMENYLDLYDFRKFYNIERVLLILPYFKRETSQENTMELVKLGKQVKMLSTWIYISFALLILYVIILIVLFGH